MTGIETKDCSRTQGLPGSVICTVCTQMFPKAYCVLCLSRGTGDSGLPSGKDAPASFVVSLEECMPGYVLLDPHIPRNPHTPWNTCLGVHCTLPGIPPHFGYPYSAVHEHTMPPSIHAETHTQAHTRAPALPAFYGRR